MALALHEALEAASAGEVPVGAVLVKDGRVIASGRNQPVASHDPSAHAEIVALRAAAQVLGNYRLDGCELFVTLEPCAMCSGAILHARLKRLVFGAADAKTGAAGSVVNLFDNPQLNHQTAVQGGGTLDIGHAAWAQESSQLMQAFFQKRRETQRQEAQLNHPLRDDALRTPESQFANLVGYPWAPNYLGSLPALAGLRMHYLDEGPKSANLTYLCLHGNPSWSYIYRKMIPTFLASGARVVVPDLPGFGKSDKPKKDEAHSFSWHRQVLLEFVEKLDLQNIVLVVQDWGGLLGLTLPVAAPARYKGLVVMNTMLATGDAPLTPGFVAWREMCAKNPAFDIARLFSRGNPQMSAGECAAYMAPYPDAGHRAATRVFPAMVPEFPDSDGAAISREAREFWQNKWSGQSLMAIGAADPVLGTPAMSALRAIIRHCPEAMVLPEAGHFVQEQGEAIAIAAATIHW